MELRWVMRDKSVPVIPAVYGIGVVHKIVKEKILQFRQMAVSNDGISIRHTWTEWEDVPIIEED